MPTPVSTKPWSTQYKEEYKKKGPKQRVTFRSASAPRRHNPRPNQITLDHARLAYPSNSPVNKALQVSLRDYTLNKENHEPKIHPKQYPPRQCTETDYFGNSYADPHPPDVTTKPRALHARPYSTVGFHRNPTPLALPGDDIEDRPDSAEPSFLFGATEGIERGAPLTFVPELDSWITNANTDYERDTVFRVRKAMNGYRTPRQRSRSVSPTRTRPYFGRTTTYGDGFNFSSTYANPGTSGVPTWNPYVCTPRYNDDMFMSQIARHLPGENSVPNMTMYATPRDSRPMHRHMRRSSFTKGYVHDLSCFTSTQPMVTGHYIIHPDWVSERLSPRREKTMNL